MLIDMTQSSIGDLEECIYIYSEQISSKEEELKQLMKSHADIQAREMECYSENVKFETLFMNAHFRKLYST